MTNSDRFILGLILVTVTVYGAAVNYAVDQLRDEVRTYAKLRITIKKIQRCAPHGLRKQIPRFDRPGGRRSI